MKLPSGVLRMMFRPRVVHRLPGRLRVQLLSPRLLRNARRDVVELVIELIAVPEPIVAVRGDTRTGTVLIRYEPGRVTEADIVAFLHTLFEIYLVNRELLDDLPDDRWPTARRKLAELLQASLRPRLTLNRQLEIAADALV
jgi:hypothetical protein